MFMLLLWPGGANRGNWCTRKGRVGSGPWKFWCFKVVAPHVSIKDHIVLALMDKHLFVLTACRVFIGPGKPSSLVTNLSNCTSLLQGGLLEGEWGSPGWRPVRMITGSRDFILGAGAQFWPSRDFVDGCRTWDPWDHVYDVLVRFYPYRVYTDLNRHDTLEYEWSLAHCYHLIVCFDGWWLV
jgi:hypothetical protein